MCEHNIHYVVTKGGIEVVWCAICKKHKWTRSLNGQAPIGSSK